MTASRNRHREPAFIDAYKRGDSIKDIAKMMAIPYRNANRYINKAVDEGLIKRRTHRWTQAERDLMFGHHKRGLSYAKIAEAMGVKESQVAGQMKKMIDKGVVLKKAPTWTPEMDEKLTRILSFLPFRRAAEEMGVTIGSVASRAARLGLKSLNNKTDWSPDRIEFLKANYETMTQREMGAELGFSESTISLRLKKMGLKSPGMRRAAATPSYITPRAAKVEPVEVIPDTARPWLTRLRGECSYPYGERHNIHSCCAPVWRGTGMCEAHAALCGGYVKVAA